jgi:heat shock protein HslJ
MRNRYFFIVLSITSLTAILLSACAVSPASNQPPAVEKTVFVGPQLVDCTGVAPQKCLQVKENQADEYSLFYGAIEGFDFQEGNEYTLVVREEQVENPPADASNVRWILVKELSKTPVSVAPAELSQLSGQTFTLDWYLDSSGKQVQVLPNTQITAEIADGRISGSAGCNSYGAEIQINGDQIKIGMAMTTMMACDEPIMQQEQAYLQNLDKVATYQLQDGVLTFSDAQGNVILSYSTLQPTSLTGTFWQMIGYNNGKGGFSSGLLGSQVDAIFTEDGKLSGSAGCNRYNTSYQLDGDKITISPAASTRMMCAEPEGVMEQESAYLAALTNAATYTIKGDILTLTDAQGARQVEYQANPLVGPVWQLQQIQYMNDTSKTSDDPAKYTVQFLADGSLQFKADCNTGSGKYIINGNSLSIELGAMTMAACPPESLSDEFLQNLGIAASYIFQSGDLFIATQMDVAIMQFSAAP